MAWKDSKRYVTLGSVGSGASPAEKERPRFNYRQHRAFPGGVISRYDFEHLQNPPDDKQKLALALYREGLNTNSEFYRFLSFFKILNITLLTGADQVAWVNSNPVETLELSLDALRINRKHKNYTKAIEASLYRFLVDYFCNGYLQVFNASSGERVSHKTAFVPVNIDVSTTVEAWKKKMVELEGDKR